MLLTGPEIVHQMADGTIVIDPPPTPERVGPNSIDLRLGPTLRVYKAQLDYLDWVGQEGYAPSHLHRMALDRTIPGSYVLDPYEKHRTVDVPIPDDGYGLVLVPGMFYLGHTIEVAGTRNTYVPILEGRSTLARLSLQTHFSAGLGDCGWYGAQWTLEISVATPVRVRPGDAVCQVLFFKTEGVEQLYKGRYTGQTGPTAARPLPKPEPT